MKYGLDKLKKVDLRDVWPHEAFDLTKWLSEEPNLTMLSSAVGIELELIETESSVGSFNVDIYAQEAGTGRKVIIENQLEDTNHDHLGKVITYAAGKGAEVVIWVVARARDEHRQAIEWLNQHTDSNFGFFLVEIELWSIGNSLPAPRFNVVEQPNEWTKAIKLSEGLSETERVKLSYWTKYREVAQATPEFLKVFNPQKPSKDHWTTLRCGTSSYHIALLIDTQHGRIGIEFYAPDDKEIGHKAIDNTDMFEERLGLAATPFDAKKASGLRFYKNGCKIKGNEGAWSGFISEQLKWAIVMKKPIAELGLWALTSSHSEDTCGVGARIHDGWSRLFQRRGSWRCLNHWHVNRLAERQEESHHQLDALLQGLAQLAVGGRQSYFLGQLRHRAPQRLLYAHGGSHLNLGVCELGDDVVLPAHAAPGDHLAYELVLLERAAERHCFVALAGAVLARHPSYPLAPSSAVAISSCFVGNRCA